MQRNDNHSGRYAASSRPVQCAIGLLLWVVVAIPSLHAAQLQSTPAREALDATVLVMGDSLSAGYGMPAAQGWVALLDERLEKQDPGWEVVNASISGETTAGGRARIVGALARHRPRVVVVALGANDGLRGLPTAQAAANLAYMIGAAHGAGAKVLLVGMQMPPNYGPAYTRRFSAVFRELAESEDLPLVPFLMDGFADRPELFLADGIHPTAEAQALILDTVWAKLQPMLTHADARAQRR